MNIRQAKNEIKHTVEAYLKKDEAGDYEIPEIRQRPVLLMGPPGIGKTQIMEQIARELGVGLVAYTITHHTRQSAVGLPFIREEEFAGKTYSVTEYTMSEIIASVYRRIRDSGQREGILFIDEINCVSETLAPDDAAVFTVQDLRQPEDTRGMGVVAAGNPPEYNKSVRDFDMVTLGPCALYDRGSGLQGLEGVCEGTAHQRSDLKLPGTSPRQLLPCGGGCGRHAVCDGARMGGSLQSDGGL